MAADEVTIFIDRAEIERLAKSMDRVFSDFSKKDKEVILKESAKPVVAKSRQKVRNGRGRGGVLQGAVSATYRRGEIVARYYSGNLRKSLRVLDLKKSTDAFVGPKILRPARAKTYGKGDRVNAYYAQMIFGSAVAFRRKVTGAALNQSTGAVLTIIRREMDRKLNMRASKHNLR